MNALTRRRSNGFTLVELLVVILIIAALATLGIGAGLKQIDKAKRMASLAVAKGIESAVNNFFTEYGSMPGDGTEPGDAVVKTDATGVDFLEILLGEDTDINTRGIKLLQVTEGKNNANGLIYDATGDTVTGLYDPWGGPYHVMLDFDLNETVSPATAAVTATKLNGRRVAVWSNGADGVEGGGEKEDDVKTW